MFNSHKEHVVVNEPEWAGTEIVGALLPPYTPVEIVTDMLHGVPITDPYRWLEEQTSTRTREWIQKQTQYRQAYFDALPCRQQIRMRVAELLSADMLTDAWNAGDRYFFLRKERDADQPIIVVRKGLCDEDHILVNPSLRGKGNSTAVRIAAISSDGRLLAYSVREGGTDHSSLEILDTHTKCVLPDRLPEAFNTSIAFLPDNSGFVYSQRRLHDLRPNYRAVSRHRFRTDLSEDEQVFFAGDYPNLFVGIRLSIEAGIIIYILSFVGETRRTSVFLQSLKLDSEPELLLRDIEGYFLPFFVGDQLFAYTDVAAPNRRIVRIQLNDSAVQSWQDVVPESRLRIQQFTVASDRIFVTRVDGFSTTITSFELTGQQRELTGFANTGTVDFLNRTSTSGKLLFSCSSIREPLSIYCYEPEANALSICQSSRLPFDPDTISTEETLYHSKDGTTIPILLAARKDLLHSAPLPTFITGYGGFGSCVTPRFTAFATFLIEQGFLFAIPALRGGSELGEEWHLAGKRENRQKSFDDFIAAAEWLLATGRSEPERLAIGGGSNAGLLVAAVLTQRPDLFRAAICLGPLLDMARYHLFDSASGWAEEYGSPNNERDFKYLMAYSPYHHVQTGTVYPAVMFISGDADTRCNPMHARKMTARLQAASSSRSVLLDYKPTWGHTPVQPLSARIDALTDRIAFICNELSITVRIGRTR